MLRLRTLGAIDLRDRRDEPVRDVLSQPKRVALLVFLAVEGARGPVPRERVLALFWPELDEERARNALSQALYHLRQALGAEVITGARGTNLEVAPGVLACDALECARAAADGDAERTLELYAGAFCPSLTLPGAPEFEEWASAHARELRRRVLECAHRGAARLERAGERVAAARVARRAVSLTPDDEQEVRDHLALLERVGDGTGALRAYEEYAVRLRTALEAEPEPATRALAEGIRARRASQGGAETAAATGTAPAIATSTGATTAPSTAAATRDAPAASASATPAAPRRRLFVALGALGVLALILLAIRPGATDRADTEGRLAVAVFPFVARGGESTQLIGDGMPDLLAAKLDGTPPIQAIDPRSSVAAAAGRRVDAALGDDLASELGARYFVLGTVTQAGGGLEVDGTLYEVGRRARPVVTATSRGDTTELFRVVEEVAARLLAGAADERDTTFARLAAVTTGSLPALKAYLRGERALRAGRDAQAGTAFREAVQLDTTFALALYRLAMTSTWVTVPGVDDPTAVAAAAARHASRLTPVGRDLLEAYQAYRAPDIRSDARYLAITASHPDNVEAWFMLGEARFHYGPLRGASPFASRSAFERVLALDPSHSHALLHLARLAAMEGRGAQLDSLAARYAALDSAALRTLEIRAMQAWVHRDSAASARIAREASDADDLLLSSLAIAATYFALDLDGARPIVARLARSAQTANATAVARAMFTDLDLAAGRMGDDPGAALPFGDPDWRLVSEALLAADPVFGVPRERVAVLRARIQARRPFPRRALGWMPVAPEVVDATRVHLLRLLSARLGDSAGVRRHAEELRRLGGGPAGELVAAWERSARAQAARIAGTPEEVLAALEPYDFGPREGWPWRVGVLERLAMGEALLALGRDAEALPWYESFVGPYDTPFITLAQLREGGIHERAGRRARAAECYRRALAVWSDPDRTFATFVEEARAGLQRTR